jgi:hypothetical protein
MTASILALGLLACSSVNVEGRMVDGRTGEPIPGPYKVSIKALSPDVAVSCQVKQTEVGPDGRFSVPGLCAGSAYRIETDREDLWLAGVDEVPDGGFPGPTDIQAWHAPKGSGVYRYTGGTFEVLKTAADVGKVTIRTTGEPILYPDSLQTPAVIGPGDQLVLVGKTTIEEFRFEPVLASGPRVFGDADTKITMEPWSYVGVRFLDDARFEVVKATIDPALQVDKAKGNRVVRWLPAEALPAGRYALFKEGDRRMYVVDFGAAPASAVADDGEEGKERKEGKEGKEGKAGKAKGGKAD